MKYAMCDQKMDDCFAYVAGGCRLLSNTRFQKPCPFYKSGKDYAEGLRKYPIVPYSFGRGEE